MNCGFCPCAAARAKWAFAGVTASGADQIAAVKVKPARRERIIRRAFVIGEPSVSEYTTFVPEPERLGDFSDCFSWSTSGRRRLPAKPEKNRKRAQPTSYNRAAIRVNRSCRLLRAVEKANVYALGQDVPLNRLDGVRTGLKRVSAGLDIEFRIQGKKFKRVMVLRAGGRRAGAAKNRTADADLRSSIRQLRSHRNTLGGAR